MAGVVSRRLFKRATKSLVGGVNSPVRAFKSVGELLRVDDRLLEAGAQVGDLAGGGREIRIGHRSTLASALSRRLEGADKASLGSLCDHDSDAVLAAPRSLASFHVRVQRAAELVHH